MTAINVVVFYDLSEFRDHYARARVMSKNELPPLWSPPPPIGHNGGPPLDILNAKPQRRPGRPTVSRRNCEIASLNYSWMVCHCG
jgi:hypothetical protein